jgi:peptide/nickel transport system substrate-binding protein
MKKTLVALAISLCLVLSLGAQAKNGPIADKVVFSVTMDRTIGIKDTAEGKTDLFYESLNGKDYKGISASDMSKLSIYSAPSGYWDIALNPIPNKAPYQVTTKEGKTYFNPFAIREVRYAMNWLIDRKKIVDEILLGVGTPSITAFPPGQPGTYKYNLLPAKLGMSARGNEKKAIDDITAALQSASNLPENKGKLVKSGKWWTFNGEPVTVKFMIRVDDASGRLLEGRYIADQIEKAGIKVERLEWDRTKCINTQNKTDPADYLWSLYTEAWGGGGTVAWWDNNVSQYYAPWRGYMAGNNVPNYWNYTNDEIDTLSKVGYNGWFLTANEYWQKNLEAAEIGIKDSQRIFIAMQDVIWVANKARFNNRMVYGLGEGVDNWSIRSANVKPDAKGQRILRVSQYSAKGGLFMSAWDPIGTQGFSDLYATNVVFNCSDQAYFPAPNSAKYTALRVSFNPKNLSSKLEADPKGGKPLGLIPVPSNAVIFNAKTGNWESGVEYKDVSKDQSGQMDFVKNSHLTSYSKLTGIKYLPSKWHDGSQIGVADIMYATAFQYKWANKIGANDKEYDEGYASSYQSTLPSMKGIVLNKDGSFDVYYDLNWPMDKDFLANSIASAIDVKAGNPGNQTVMPWEIYEACAKLVSEGSKSGTVYTFGTDESMSEPDLINPKSVSDIKAKLQDMLAKKYVPSFITQWCTPDQAAARYKSALAFIDKYGHAYISNGPFYINKVDYNSNYIELAAYRDYLYKSDWLPKLLKTTITRIDEVKVPATAQRSKDLTIPVSVSAVAYPDDTARAADSNAKVTLSVILPDGSEKAYKASFLKAGTFQAVIPVKDLGALKAGTYTLVAQSVFGDESPSVTTSTLVLF